MKKVYILMSRTSCIGEEDDCLAIYGEREKDIVTKATRLLLDEYDWLTESFEKDEELKEAFDSVEDWVYTELNDSDIDKEEFPFYIHEYEARL